MAAAISEKIKFNIKNIDRKEIAPIIPCLEIILGLLTFMNIFSMNTCASENRIL